MFDKKRRFGLTPLFLLLASGLLAGCPLGAETRLRGYAQEFITALGVDIVEEKHEVLVAPIHIDEPTSFMVSEYIVSDTPEEVKEKLKALHLAEKGWLAPSKNGWIGGRVSSLSPRHATPERVKGELGYLLLDGDPDFDFFLVCPWYRVYNHYDDDGSYYISFLYMNAVALTNSGKLVVRIRDTKNERSLSCLTASGSRN